MNEEESTLAQILEKYLECSYVDAGGVVCERFEKKRVDKIGDLEVQVYRDHVPPRFHVSSKQKSIDARFHLSSCRFLNNKHGVISNSDIEIIKNFYNQNPDRFKNLVKEHGQMNQ